MSQFEYSVEWDSDITTEYGKPVRYRQDFESLEEARMAMALHNNRNSELHVTIKK